MISWQTFLTKVIDHFKNKGYNFNHIEELNIITRAKKSDMSYDYKIKHNMNLVEWKLNAMIIKNKICSMKSTRLGDILWIENLEVIVFNKWIITIKVHVIKQLNWNIKGLI